MEKEKKNLTQDTKKIKWIQINPKYMSICRYAILVILCAIVLFMVISKWSATIRVIRNFLHVLSPFLIGLLIAYFLMPMVTRLDAFLKKRITKGKAPKVTKVAALVMSYVVVFGFISFAFVFVIPQVGESIRELTFRLPAMYDVVMKEIKVLDEKFPQYNMEELEEQLAGLLPELVGFGKNLVSNVVPMIYSASISVVTFAINLVLGLFISIYMIFSKDKYIYQGKRIVYAIFPEEKGKEICSTLRECNHIFGSFLISKAIDSLIIGCLCCILMNILQLPYAVLLSVIVGITNMIPYFGPFIGAVPGVLIYLCTDFESAVVFGIMIFLLQQFDGLILGPKLLGDSTGLSPIWVIFAITVGGAYFGVVGMFVGVPVVAVIAYLADKLISGRLKGKKIKELEKYEKQEK